MPSDITMKNLVPPKAHSKPKTTAICIQNLRFSGVFWAITPETSIGNPNREGKNEVIEFDLDIIETITPQAIKNVPKPIVILGIDCPATVNPSSIDNGYEDPLKFL